MENIKDQLSAHMSENRISQEAAAAGIGVSGSSLSYWRRGKYTGDNARMESLVSEYLGRCQKVEREVSTYKKDFDFVPTSVYEDVRKCVELADLRGEIRAIVGDSGIGKTTAIRHIASERSNVILVEAYRGIRKNRFMAKLCKAAGFNARGSFDDMFEEIAARIRPEDTIAIDEAEHLPLDAIDAVRRFNDFKGCGVVMIGLPIFYERLRLHQREYAYIYNRTSIPLKLSHLKTDDQQRMVRTMVDCTVDPAVWNEACAGVGRDLKMIVQESLRVAEKNGIGTDDVAKFVGVIRRVKKELGRTA